MFEVIQYFVSSKKLEDGFGMDNVVVVNGRGKITRLCDDNMGLDLKFNIIILHVSCMTFWFKLKILDWLLMF